MSPAFLAYTFLLAFVSNAIFLLGIALIAGVSGLIYGSRYINRSITVIAREAGVPVFVIALFLVAFSTSIPELTVAVVSSLKGVPVLSYGDIYGSNIFNLACILPVVLLVSSKIVHVETLISRREQLAIYAISTLPVLMMLTGTFSRLDGIILLSIFFIFLFHLIQNKRIEIPPELVTAPTMGEQRAASDTRRGPKRKNIIPRIVAGCWNIRNDLATFAFGALFLVGGAQLVVYGAVGLAKEIHVPLFFIGLLLISVGTSLPELSFGIRSGLEKRPENSMGDVIGSSAVNSCLVLGVSAIICPMNVAPIWQTLRLPAYLMILVFATLFLLSFPKRGLNKYSALALLAVYLVFLSLQIRYFGVQM
jgi:cation:H+ antiporter